MQGHEKAADLLQQCLDSGRGISEENEAEVRCCLSSTPGERAARKAARDLFACLSNGSQGITPKKLERKMREIYNMQKRRRRRNCSSSTSGEDTEEDQPAGAASHSLKQLNKSKRNVHVDTHRSSLNLNAADEQERPEYITEENLVSAAVNYAAGRMPSVSQALTLSVPHPSTLDHVPCFHRLFFHPVIFFTLLYHKLINFITAVPSAIPPNVRLSICLLISWLSSNDSALVYLPTGLYYLTIAVMLWSTCKMLKTRHDFIDFRIWSGLFLSYGENIEADNSEHRFLKNNMRPYLYFFCAFVCNFVVYPLIESEWLLHSEITIVSGVFVFLTLFRLTSLERTGRWVVLVSFAVNVLAKYPYEMDEVVLKSWRFLDLKAPAFFTFVIGNGIEFCLSCRAAFYLMIPGFLVHLAKRSSWHGTYVDLIPHCVTLSWLQLCITASRSATMFGMLRATLGLAGMVLFLPLFGIITLLVPVFLAIDYMGLSDSRVRLRTTVTAALLAILGSCFLAVNRWTQKYITLLQVVTCIVAATVLTLPYMTSDFKEPLRFGNLNMPSPHKSIVADNDAHQHAMRADLLSWQKFQSFCGHKNEDEPNKIKAQLRCTVFDGMPVLWEGKVDQVEIIRVSNSFVELVNTYLPQWLGNMIKCFYGEYDLKTKLCDPDEDSLCDDLQRLLEQMDIKGSKCSVHKWNVYEYEVLVYMSSGIFKNQKLQVKLHAGQKFANFTRGLQKDDRLKFYGLLSNSKTNSQGIREDFRLGATIPQIELLAVSCIQCEHEMEAVSEDVPHRSLVDARLRDLKRGFKYLLNVLFDPLIKIK